MAAVTPDPVDPLDFADRELNLEESTATAWYARPAFVGIASSVGGAVATAGVIYALSNAGYLSNAPKKTSSTPLKVSKPSTAPATPVKTLKPSTASNVEYETILVQTPNGEVRYSIAAENVEGLNRVVAFAEKMNKGPLTDEQQWDVLIQLDGILSTDPKNPTYDKTNKPYRIIGKEIEQGLIDKLMPGVRREAYKLENF
jgi:hypothetical protein